MWSHGGQTALGELAEATPSFWGAVQFLEAFSLRGHEIATAVTPTTLSMRLEVLDRCERVVRLSLQREGRRREPHMDRRQMITCCNDLVYLLCLIVQIYIFACRRHSWDEERIRESREDGGRLLSAKGGFKCKTVLGRGV